jgi:bacterioferritin
VIVLVSKELLELVNKGIARELHASITYMWQRMMAKGVEGATTENIFREAATTEMKHAEQLAERLVFLDGVPPDNIETIHVGTALEEILKEDIQRLEEMISLFKQAIQLASKEGDFTTRRLLEEVLSSEEHLLDRFSKLIVGMTSPFTQPQV